MLRFRDRVLRFRDLGASFSSFGCFVFEIWVLRFRDLGASFSRFGCFVLRSSFSSASFSKLPFPRADSWGPHSSVERERNFVVPNVFHNMKLGMRRAYRVNKNGVQLFITGGRITNQRKRKCL